MLRAGLRQPGQLALVDTWALAHQSVRLLEDGDGAAAALGAGRPLAAGTARALADEADALAASLLEPRVHAAYRAFVADWIRAGCGWSARSRWSTTC